MTSAPDPLRIPKAALAALVVLDACVPAMPPDDAPTDTESPPAAAIPSDLGLRPLTGAELDHAVEDLLGVAWTPSTLLPPTVQSGYATDVRGGSVDAYRVERMLAVAEATAAALDHADPAHTVVVELEDLDVPWDATLDVPGATATTWVSTYGPREVDAPVTLAMAGAWTLRVAIGHVIAPPAGIGDFDAPLRFQVRLDGVEVADLPIEAHGPGGDPVDVPVTASAGRHVLTLVLDGGPQRVPVVDGFRLIPADAPPGLLVRAEACDAEADPVACVENLLSPLARRAWRLPPDDARRAALRAVLDAEAARGGTPVDVARLGVEALLASPDTWFVAEGGQGRLDDGGRYVLGPHEVATRLALLVWQSVPDDALLDCADQGLLGADDDGPCGLGPQLDRLLDDARSARLVTGFASAWLGLGSLDELALDAATFPELDRALVDALREEARLVTAEVFFGDRPLAELVESDFTWVDARLADHYGLDAPEGPDFTRVATDPGVRGGLVRAGGVLLATAHPTRISDVRRGRLLLSAFACEPQSSPPPDVPALSDDDERASLVELTAPPACAGCHDALNPFGFALSAYDVAGRHVPGAFVDVSEQGYPRAFHAASELLAFLRADDLAPRCFGRHLASWATSRDLATLDEAALAAIDADLSARGATLRAALHAVARSPLFLTRPAEVP